MIAFYCRKLTDVQQQYTVTERELLSIVENLKDFRTILLGQKLRIYTDHKNLTCKIFNTVRLLRWRLILEDYGPESGRGWLIEVVGDIQVDDVPCWEIRRRSGVTER